MRVRSLAGMICMLLTAREVPPRHSVRRLSQGGLLQSARTRAARSVPRRQHGTPLCACNVTSFVNGHHFVPDTIVQAKKVLLCGKGTQRAPPMLENTTLHNIRIVNRFCSYVYRIPLRS